MCKQYLIIPPMSDEYLSLIFPQNGGSLRYQSICQITKVAVLLPHSRTSQSAPHDKILSWPSFCCSASADVGSGHISSHEGEHRRVLSEARCTPPWIVSCTWTLIVATVLGHSDLQQWPTLTISKLVLGFKMMDHLKKFKVLSQNVVDDIESDKNGRTN